MNHKSIVKFCKELGCCDACCLRYLGLKNPSSYEDVHLFIRKYLDDNAEGQQQSSDFERNVENDLLTISKDTASFPLNTDSAPVDTDSISAQGHSPPVEDDGSAVHVPHCADDSTDAVPPAKRIRLDTVCVSCLGVLQEETWPEGFTMVQDVLNKKCYECDTIACALSSPIAAILRERTVTLRLEDAFPGYDHGSPMPLKEAWKWLFARRAAPLAGKRLDSGAVTPLLVTLNVEYADEPQELELLRALAPRLFEARGRQRRRFAVEFTRRAAEQALIGAELRALPAAWRAGPPRPAVHARPVGATAAHAPLYLAGRYVKLSRSLPQTPWLVEGRRVLHSSVQEIIFAPVAAAYGLSSEEAEHRLKLMSAGREDVDVRCLGTGRPFALEVTDPRRRPSAEELARACELISADKKVLVRNLVPITREDLAQLKQGEESKCKTYEALCIKLGHTDDEPAAANGSGPRVTERDVARINAYRNTPPGDVARVRLAQRTPVRVLHRRPLLTRARALYSLSARAVPAQPALFVVRLRTEAGTYVKEWAHGELRRTRPSLADALGARADILALDVADVDLPWPPAR